MTTGVGGRFAVMTARAPLHPSQLAFFIAHELGHIALGHVSAGGSILEGPLMSSDAEDSSDTEEQAADAYAFELLAGNARFEVKANPARGTAKELADIAIDTGKRLEITPGFVILCYGRSTKNWPLATSALKLLPDYNPQIAGLVNKALRSQLDSEMLSSEDLSYLDEVAAI